MSGKPELLDAVPVLPAADIPAAVTGPRRLPTGGRLRPCSGFP